MMSIGRDDFNLLLEKIEKSEERSEGLESLQAEIRSKKFDDNQLQQLYLAGIVKSPDFLKDLNGMPLDVKFKIALELVKNKRGWEYLEVIRSDTETNPRENEYNIFLPEKQYKEVCLVAIKINVEALMGIPKEMYDFELLLASVRQHGGAITVVKNYDNNNIKITANQYKELCFEAVKKTPMALEEIDLPDDQFKGICLAAVREDFHAIVCVPVTLRRHKEFKEVIEKWRAEAIKDPSLIQHHKVPEELLTQEICNAAFQADYYAQSYIPKQFLNFNLLKLGVTHVDAINLLYLLRNYKNDTSLNEEECKILIKEIVENNLTKTSFLIRTLRDYKNDNLITEDEYKLYLKTIVENNSIDALMDVTRGEKQLDLLLELIKSKKTDLESTLIMLTYWDLTDSDLKELYSTSVEAQPLSINQVPITLRNIKMCLAAVSGDFRAVIHVPEPLLDRVEFKEAIKKWRVEIAKDGKLIKETPEKILNQETCETAVQSTVEALPYIPKQYLTYNLFKIASNNSDSNKILASLHDYKNKTLLTKEEYKNILKVIVEKNAVYSYLHYASADMLLDLSLESIRQKNDYELSYILSGEAVKSYVDYKEIKLTEPELKEVRLAAVKKDGLLIEYIPKAMRDYEICFESIKQNPDAFELIKNREITGLNDEQYKQICLVAVAKKPQLLKSVPVETRNLEICLSAVLTDFREIIHVPDDLLDHVAFKEAKEKWQAELSKDWSLLECTPVKLLTQDICNLAVKSSLVYLEHIPKQFRTYSLFKLGLEDNYFVGRMLPFLRDYKQTTLLTNDEYELIFKEIIDKGNINDLLNEPSLEKRQYEILLERVKKNAFELSHVMDNNNLKLTAVQLKEVYLVSVKSVGESLRFIPNKHRDFEICLESVKQNSSSIQYIDNPHDSNLTDEEYKKLCLMAVKQNGIFLEHIPQKNRDFDIYLESVKQTSAAFKFMKNYRETNLTEKEFKLICLVVVKNDGLLLEDISSELRDYDICLESVKQNPQALEFVDEKYKSRIIEEIGPEKILVKDYELMKYFPSKYSSETFISGFLSKITNIVVTGANDFYADHEVNDAYLIYAHSPARKDKTLHVNTDKLGQLLADIRKYQGDSCQINLVLLGHAARGVDAMAGMKAIEIATLVANHTSIQKVTLLGCHTAESQPTEKEKMMIQQYQEGLKSPTRTSPSGVILMFDLPTKEQYAEFFKKMGVSKEQPTDTLFILVNNRSLQQQCIIELKRDASSGQITPTRYDLTEESKSKVGKLIGHEGNAKIPTPSKKNPIIYYKGGKSAEYVTSDNTAKLVDILNANEPRFSRRHPHYKEDKQMFPFMAGVKLEESEEHKVLPSLLKHVKDAIEGEPRITRTITVKGYTKAVHVDTMEQQMKVYGTHLYKSEYSGKDRTTFFSESKDNIDRKKLADERKKEIEKMASGETGDKSTAKSITVVVKKNK